MLDEGPAPQRIVNSSSRRSSPTFVQIRKPAAAGDAKRTVGILLGGLGLVAVLVWLAPRDPLPPPVSAEIEAPARQIANAPETNPDAGTPTPEPEVLALQEAPPPDDTGATAAGPEMGLPTEAPVSEPRAAMLVPAVVETSARLKKGGTVAGALHGLGIAVKDVSSAVSALKSRVRLNRLPVGQEITVKLGPADGADEPLLMALAIRPEPRREITLERDDSGDFSVEEEVYDTVARLQRAAGTVDG